MTGLGDMANFKTKHPWRAGLLVATLISAMVFLASLLWQAGLAQWGFVLLFGALWLLTSLFLANDEFNEESGLILARVLDDNVDHLLDRIRELEQRLATVGSASPEAQHSPPRILDGLDPTAPNNSARSSSI